MLIIGNLLQLEKNFLKRVDAGEEVTKVLDAIVYHFLHSPSHTSVSVDGKYIAFALKKVSSRSVTFATKSVSKKGNISLLYENQVGAKSWLKLPQSTFDGMTESVLFYEMVANHAMPTLSNQSLVSNILSAKILTDKKSFENLNEPVQIKFDVGKLDGVNISCRFWDEEKGIRNFYIKS